MNSSEAGESTQTPESADPATHALSPAGVQAPSSDSPTSAYTAASTPTDPSASGYPKCTFSGFQKPDPNYYIREGDSLFKLHLDNIIKAFDELKVLLNALAKKDRDKKEILRKHLKIALDNMSKTMNR